MTIGWQRAAPFAIGAIVPFLALLVPPDTHDVPRTIAAAGLTVLLGLVGWVAHERGAPASFFSALALGYLPVVALLRDSEGGSVSGYGPLVLMPLLWISLYGGRRMLIACIVGIWLVLVLPIFLIGGAGYDSDAEGRRAVVWVIAALLVGPTVQELVRRMRESELRYRSIFENVREVVFQTDLEGRWTVLNPAWQEITGYDVDTSLGRRFVEFVHDEDVAGNAEQFERLRNLDIANYRYEMRYRTADDTYRWLEVWARRLEDEHGQVVGVTGTLSDITDRCEAERMKEQFFALVSHELRTPLAAIIGYLELLDEEEGERLSEDGRNFVAVMQRNSQRLMRLIGDLLFAAQVEAGTLSLQRSQVDLAAIVRDACESAQPRAVQQQLALEASIEVEPAPAFGDQGRLGQVLDNLLTNAIKFTPAGGSIRLRLARETSEELGEVYAIEVTDTGPGIPEDEQERLFERFRRARAAEEEAVQGVGLGLAISRAIVDGHGGRIGLRSTLGEGTTFRVELPLQDEAQAREGA